MIETRKRAPRAKQSLTVSTNPDALLTIETVAELTGYKPDTVRKLVLKGGFPKPFHLGGSKHSKRWRAEVVNAWMRERATLQA
jgi:predicted DNA-binding transcriptional regulator AlpA